MSLASLFCLLCALAGTSAAQDTNFSAGPQYLITGGSPMFLHPIATPSLSLEPSVAEVQSLPQIGPVVEDQSFVVSPEPRRGADLFPIFYGSPTTETATSVVEITSAEAPLSLPASITEVGVTGVVDAQSLRERGYGVPLGDTASFWKAHKPSAAHHVYTNAEVQRLHAS
jgi:hypothetical protein